MPDFRPDLVVDPATGRVYIVTRWADGPAGPVALDHTDVTDRYLRIVTWHAERGQPRA